MRYLILFAIWNSEVSAIEGAKCIGITGTHSVLPKKCAIKRFPLKGESVKGGSTVVSAPVGEQNL